MCMFNMLDAGQYVSEVDIPYLIFTSWSGEQIALMRFGDT